MEDKKYILTDETINFRGHILHRIQAVKDIGKQLVKKEDLGGWVESERNLLHEGDCWIFDDAKGEKIGGMLFSDTYYSDLEGLDINRKNGTKVLYSNLPL